MTGARTAPHMLTLVAISGLAALSMNVFLPSLPGMARGFDVEYGYMQLSVSAYIGVSAILQLLAGPISDRHGRRPVVLTGMIVFLLATIGTLLAQTATTFLIFRLIQASISVGMLIPRAAVRDMFDGDRAASMIGYVTMGMAAVPMLAPIIGGVIDEAFGWRTNFALMGVLGIGVLILTWADMGETVQKGGVPLRQQMRNYPVLLRSVRFWGYCLSATLCSGAFFAYLGGAPFVGEKVFGLTSSQVGYYFAAPSLGYLAGNFISGRYAARLGMNRMIMTGTSVCFVALALALIGDLAGIHSPMLFFGATVFMGLGNGLALPSANVGMMNVRPELAGTASGLGGAMAIAGGAALSALAGALLTEGRGATPLLIVMTLSSLGAVLSIQWVKLRERQLGLV